MNTKDFEIKLKEIDPELNIRINPNATDIAGIYWGNIYVGISCPPKEIKEEIDTQYQDAMGNPYRSQRQVMEMLPIKLARIKSAFAEDPSIFE